MKARTTAILHSNKVHLVQPAVFFNLWWWIQDENTAG